MQNYKKHQTTTGKPLVLIVNLQGKIAGAEKSLLLILQFLSSFRFLIACPDSSNLSGKIRKLGYNVQNLPEPPKSFHSFSALLYFIRTNIKMTVIVSKTKPDIVHANNTKAALACLLAVAVLRKKFIFHARDLKTNRLAQKFCASFAKKIIAVSQSVKKALIKNTISPSKIKTIYNGTITKQTKNIFPERFGNKTTFANIGQFIPWKKQTFYLKAAALFLEKNLNAEFLLIGDDIYQRNGNYQKKLIRKLENKPLRNHTTLMNWQENLERIWPKINCLVHTADKEPFGRVIIEAMAHNVNVIAVKNAGPAEIITNYKDGILVPPNNPERLSNAMMEIAKNRNLARNLSLAAFRTIQHKFDAQKNARQIKNIYETLLKN